MATKPRTRKKVPAAPAPVETPAVETPAVETSVVAPATTPQAQPANGKNVSPFEGTLSVCAGGLLIVAALFPRTLKQLVLLGLGASFLYRGQTRQCGVYSALGIDTNR